MDNEKMTQERIEKAAEQLLKGATIRQLKGLSAEEMEAIYAMGYNFYTSGRLVDADKVFRFLVLIDHTCAKYWMGMGAVQQLKRDYGSAVKSYGYASFLNLHDPRPQYYAAECFRAMGDAENALSALAALEQYAPAGHPFRAKAAELKAKLEAKKGE